MHPLLEIYTQGIGVSRKKTEINGVLTLILKLVVLIICRRISKF